METGVVVYFGVKAIGNNASTAALVRMKPKRV
jgi:hypothetical protein